MSSKERFSIWDVIPAFFIAAGVLGVALTVYEVSITHGRIGGPKVVLNKNNGTHWDGTNVVRTRFYSIGIWYKGDYDCVQIVSEYPGDASYNSNAYEAALEIKSRLERQIKR